MSKTKKEQQKLNADLPIHALLLECNTDRYKLAYAAIRWAKEIKKKENLPESVPVLVQRAIREILTGKVDIEDIGKLPVLARVAPPPPPAPVAPKLTLTVAPEAAAESL
jgi:DNA-directed RNA polymerase subunit K/omega